MLTVGCTPRVPSRLILMRHAKSDYPPDVADHDRPLNARGRRDAAAAGEWLAANRAELVQGSLAVVVSSACRAQQTWVIAGDGFAASFRTEPRIYESSVSTLIDVAAACGERTVLIVGHNPTIEDAIAHLAGRSAGAVKTSAIAVIDLQREDPWSSGTAVVSAFIVPRGTDQSGGSGGAEPT